MEKERILEVSKLTKEWEELVEEIRMLETNINKDTNCALTNGFGRLGLITYLNKEEIEFILNNRKVKLQELEKELGAFIEEINPNIENNIDIEVANIGKELNENYKKLMEDDISREKVREFMRKVRMAQTKYIELLKRKVA